MNKYHRESFASRATKLGCLVAVVRSRFLYILRHFAVGPLHLTHILLQMSHINLKFLLRCRVTGITGVYLLGRVFNLNMI